MDKTRSKQKNNKENKPKHYNTLCSHTSFCKKKFDKDYISSNIISLKNVLEFAKKKELISFFIFFFLKYMDLLTEKNVNEDDIFLKPDILGATKILSEKLIEHQKLNYLIIRLPE